MTENTRPASEMTDDEFAAEFRAWLDANLVGEFAEIKGAGGPGSEHEFFPQRLAWDRHMAAAGWACVGWPVEHGGRGASLSQQVRFHEEYAKADAPARVSHLGETLLGPTLIAHGTQEQKERFLPRIADVTELWAQGYSEPGAGSDLANVATTAELREDGKWHLDGQKVWTSLAHLSQWAFVVARTEEGTSRHKGLSFLLVPLDQPGVTIRPIQQITGTSEFNEVFFDDAVTDADLIVGAPGDGWKVAMGLLQFERGVSTLGQQVGFARELENLVDLAKANGAVDDPEIASRLRRAKVGLMVMEANARRTLAGDIVSEAGAASVAKLLWANWHRDLGQLAIDVVGAPGLLGPDQTSEGRVNDIYDPEHVELDEWQRLLLFTRAVTIYGGSNEVQRNIIAERVLGLPREARP